MLEKHGLLWQKDLIAKSAPGTVSGQYALPPATDSNHLNAMQKQIAVFRSTGSQRSSETLTLLKISYEPGSGQYSGQLGEEANGRHVLTIAGCESIEEVWQTVLAQKEQGFEVGNVLIEIHNCPDDPALTNKNPDADPAGNELAIARSRLEMIPALKKQLESVQAQLDSERQARVLAEQAAAMATAAYQRISGAEVQTVDQTPADTAIGNRMGTAGKPMATRNKPVANKAKVKQGRNG